MQRRTAGAVREVCPDFFGARGDFSGSEDVQFEGALVDVVHRVVPFQHPDLDISVQVGGFADRAAVLVRKSSGSGEGLNNAAVVAEPVWVRGDLSELVRVTCPAYQAPHPDGIIKRKKVGPANHIPEP